MGGVRWGAAARRAASVVLLLAAFGFLARTAARHWGDLDQFDWDADPLMLLLSVMVHVAVLCWGVLLWSLVVARFDEPTPSFPKLLRIWALSNAARYIPGAVWQFLAAAQMSREAGMSRTVALSSMVVHVGFTLLGAGLISAFTLPLADLGVDGADAWIARAAMVGLCAVLVHPAVLNAALAFLPRLIGRDIVRWGGSWRSGAGLLTLAVVNWILYGIAYYLFVDALTPLSWSVLPRLAGVNALSFLAGYLAVLAPGGLGVRESAMTLLLSPLLPAGVAALLAVLARLWSIVAEVTLALGAVAAARLTHPPRRA